MCRLIEGMQAGVRFTYPEYISSVVIARNCVRRAKRFGRVTKQSIFTEHQNLILGKRGLLRRRYFRCRESREAPRNDEGGY
jgi:hypothetical protein